MFIKEEYKYYTKLLKINPLKWKLCLFKFQIKTLIKGTNEKIRPCINYLIFLVCHLIFFWDLKEMWKIYNNFIGINTTV